MIIYFLEANKIYTFKLPLEVSGNYILSDYDVNGNKRSLVSVEAREGKWVIKDNDEVKIYYNNMYNKEATLDLYHFYQLVVYGTETILMYIAPAYDNSFICTRVQDNTTIHIGNDGCDINFPIIGKKQLEITYKKGNFSFKNLNNNVPIYVNNSRKDLGSLNNFDVIFIMGLRILVLGGNIYVNNPNGQVILVSNKFSQPQLNLLHEDYKATAEFYKDFYDEKDYFYKTPVFQNALQKQEIAVALPPQKMQNRGNPILLQIGPSALMSVTSVIAGFQAFSQISAGEGTVSDHMMTIIGCITLIIGSIVWPFFERFYEKITEKANEVRRELVYKKYLKGKREIFENTAKKQKTVLIERHLSLEECKQAIYNKNPNLFSRDYDNEYFLSVRLGVGNVNLNADINFERAEYDEVKDKLLEKAQDLIDEYKVLKDTPYSLSLYDKNITAFIGSSVLKNNYLSAIVLQLITFHSYADLRIVVLSDNAAPSCLHYLKESNYCFSDDKSFRFYSESFDDGQLISQYLEKIFVSRSGMQEVINKIDDGRDKKLFPFYLVVSDNISMYKNLKIVNDILESKKNVGFGLLMFDDRVSNIPEGCKNFVNYNEKEGYYFVSEMDMDSIRKFKPEFIGEDYANINIDDCISKVSNIPLRVETNDSGTLPDSLGFLEMYGVGKIEQLNILNRWKTSNIVNSLATPVGVDTNGKLLYLDLHEKKHGPHGLVAGMTGSGKSETIVTYLLSLAVNYSPNEVQFVLIDYKGGGLAGAFENRKTGRKLPHLVGTITNLDQSEMKRTLVSIKSELQRRQRVFNAAKEQLNTGNIDIYKYQRLVRDGKLTEYMSHLFIVCDEFAELKAQQPDFMDELVSAARIGRSLGIHLILATQKPSGVVDDQIWSNSKFKICHKVQTSEDSNEMIRRSDAAFIKESGRFYLQVGYDEYFVKAQSAYTGGPYVPSDKTRSKYSTAVEFINNQADIIKTISKDDKVESKKENLGEELINISNYMIDLANEQGFKYQQLWLDNVPKELYLENVQKKYAIQPKPFIISPLVGEYDDPKNQKQGPVVLELTNGGNTFILGSTGMGKTTLVSTIIYSTVINHSPQEVNFYIIDLGTEKLRMFSRLPQVGDVLGIYDKQKISYLFYMIDSEIVKRQKYYTEHGGDFATDVKQGKCVFPNIIVIIHGMDTFKEAYEEVYDEKFTPLTRNCTKYGITFVITGAASSSISYSVDNNFPQKIVLNMTDESEYTSYYNEKLVPSKNPGRGIIGHDSSPIEFQTALIFDEIHATQNLNYVIGQLVKHFPNKATPIASVPRHLSFNDIVPLISNIKNVPIGINVVTAQYGYYDFSPKVTLMSASKKDLLKKFIPQFAKVLSKCQNNKVMVLNAIDNLDLKFEETIKYYNSNFKNLFPVLDKNVKKAKEEKSDKTFTIIVLGYSKLNSHMKGLQKDDNTVMDLDTLILEASTGETFKFILFEPSSSFSKVMDGALSDIVDNQYGIWVGQDYDDQDCFESARSYASSDVVLSNDTVVIINDSTPGYLKYPTA